MYKSKLDNNEKSKDLIKKILVKSYMKAFLKLLALFDILMGIVILILTQLINPVIIFLLPAAIIMQDIICICAVKKELKKFDKRNTYVKEKTIDFNDDGILYKKGDEEVMVQWQGVRRIQVFEEYFIADFDILGSSGILFLFSEFEGEKEDIVAQIEKYKKVERC